MDGWIDLARGPIFRLALAICVLGLAYRVATAVWQVAAAHRRAGDRRLPVQMIVRATLRWLFPVRLIRVRPVYSVASFIFHVGILAVPLFYVGHVTLWKKSLTIPWPTLSPAVTDVVALAAMVGLGVVLASRLLVPASRDLTEREDVWILLLLLAALASGYWASHPVTSPFAPRAMLLVHILLANLALVLTPLTKIVHCVLAPFSQLISEVGWRFPADSGRHVATALGKENEAI